MPKSHESPMPNTPDFASQDIRNADAQDAQQQNQRTQDGRPLFGPRTNSHPGPDEREAVVGDADLPQRAAGHAGAQAGSGVPGLGGSPGGTSNYGGVGLPGAAQRLGRGSAATDDPRLGGSAATGGLGTGGQPASGLGSVGSAEVLPGGATRLTTSDVAEKDANASNSAHHRYAVEHADLGALEPGHGAMMNAEPGNTGANSISTRGDEAVTMQRSARGGANAAPPPTDFESDGGPAQSGSIAQNPRTDPTHSPQE